MPFLGVTLSIHDSIIQAVIILVVIALIAVTTLIRFYAYITCGYFRGGESMKGKVVLITGATGGIGFETAKAIAKRGATVILACRNLASANKAKDNIITETKNDKILVKRLDLASQKSIREFADEVRKTTSRLDVLIHNAGTAEIKYSRTEDNVETTMATNYFGPFLLTHLLIDLLKQSAPSRIVVVASELYRLANLNLDKLNPTNTWLSGYYYYVSKYANICFTNELARRLENTGVTANCLHPGIIDTGIWRNVPIPFRWALQLIIKGFCKTTIQGCQTTLFCAVNAELETVTGKYFMDCRQATLRPGASDMAMAKKLWELSEPLAGLKSTDPKI